MKFTLYTANCTGNEKNILYPNQKIITSEADLKKAVVLSMRILHAVMPISCCLM